MVGKYRFNVCVVIASANRRNLLESTLTQLSIQTLIPRLIVIVEHLDAPGLDSSVLAIPELLQERVVQIPAKKASAASQRNLGLDYLVSTKGMNCDVVIFHDDDLNIEIDYIEKLYHALVGNSEMVGISGFALPGQSNQRGIVGLLKRILRFDSKEGGVVLPNTINVPFKLRDSESKQTYISEWLFGCAAWKLQYILDIRFEEDFTGQSIAEDLIFSMRVGRRGKLAVNTSVKFIHHESAIGRDANFEFLKNWIKNHYRMFEIFPEKNFSELSFRITCLILILRNGIRNFEFNRNFFFKMLKLIRITFYEKS